MSIAIHSSKSPSPYDVGSTEFRKAREDMQKLSKLKVTEDTYKNANSAKSSWWDWNWISGNDADLKKIEKQTSLEKAISKNLYSIAAANVRNPDAVPAKVLEQARQLEDKLSERKIQDYQKANAAEVEPYGQDAYNAMSDEYSLHRALNDVKPDAIPLQKTQSFLDQVTKLHDRIDEEATLLFWGGRTASERSEARKNLAHDWKELNKKIDLTRAQGGDSVSPGIIDPKIDALPDGDPLKNAYLEQDRALGKLDRLFLDSQQDFEDARGK